MFYWTNAMKKLKEDVDADLHLTMTPSQLRMTRPDEYGAFPLKVFDQRLRQAIRKKRLVNWKNDKRDEVINRRKECRRELNLSEETPKEMRERLMRERQEQQGI